MYRGRKPEPKPKPGSARGWWNGAGRADAPTHTPKLYKLDESKDALRRPRCGATSGEIVSRNPTCLVCRALLED